MENIKMSECHDEYEGLVQMESWDIIEIVSEPESIKSDELNAYTLHPLLLPGVLDKVFTYLTAVEDITNSRLVCQTWRNTLKDTMYLPYQMAIDRVGGRGGVTSFINMMSSPHAQLPFRNMILRCAHMESQPVVQLFNMYGPLLRELTLWMLDLSSLSFLWLPIWCPNLIKITFKLESASLSGSQLSETIRRSPTLFQKAWLRPFPHLKELIFSEHLAAYPNTDKMEQFILTLFAKSGTIERLTLSEVTFDTWNRIAPEMAQSPELMRQLVSLELDLCNAQLESWLKLQMQLKNLGIINIFWGTSPQAFSSFLENNSETLETFRIDESYKERNPADSFKVIFPRRMNSLMNLYVAAVPEVCALDVESHGMDNLFNFLPNLKACAFCTFNEDKHLGNIFWSGVFPIKEPGRTVINAKLTHLRVDWYLEEAWIAKEIRRCFPSIVELHLLIEGSLLPGIIEEFKDSKVEEFHFAYFEMEGNGDMVFTSQLTGIPVEHCLDLVEEDFYRKYDRGENLLKVGPSLADWKNLKVLDISYKKKIKWINLSKDTGCVPLNGVAVWLGLGLLNNLTNLMLRHFTVEEKFILRLAKKIPVKRMSFSHCDINYHNASTALESIQTKCPNIELSYF